MEGWDSQIPSSLENGSSGKEIRSHLHTFAHAGISALNAPSFSWGGGVEAGLGREILKGPV